MLESQTVISRDERLEILKGTGLTGSLVDDIWMRISATDH
jgi:hypothetical protein